MCEENQWHSMAFNLLNKVFINRYLLYRNTGSAVCLIHLTEIIITTGVGHPTATETVKGGQCYAHGTIHLFTHSE